MKGRVAALRVQPETVLDGIEKLCELAGIEQTLAAGKTTILKDNISWHFPFPGANTTPWYTQERISILMPPCSQLPEVCHLRMVAMKCPRLPLFAISQNLLAMSRL